MAEINESIRLLIENINETARNEQQHITKLSLEESAKLQAKTDDEVREKYNKLVREEKQKLSLKTGKESTELIEESRNRIEKIREEVFLSVKEKALKEAESFVRSEDYPSFFERVVKQIADYCRNECTVIVNSRDTELAQKYMAFFEKASIKTDDERIKLGGVICVFEDRNITADNSLDSLLDEKLQEFVNKASLGF